MTKDEIISHLMDKISQNEKFKKTLLGISNDQCLHENITDTKERNKLFIFLGTSLALLAFSDIINFKDESNYCESVGDDPIIIELTEKIAKNKNLFNLVAEIVKNTINEDESRIRYHFFLMTALPILAERNIIDIKEGWNNKSPF